MARSGKRKLMAEINVVPYIDVMLVLLVIFMITAPLMTQGIKVDLPDAQSGPMDIKSEEQLLVVTIKADGSYFMNVGESEEAVALEKIGERTGKIIQANPEIRVLVEGDKNIPYGVVIRLMDILEHAGADSIGLITDLPES